MGKPQIKKASRNLAAEHRIAPAQNHNSENLWQLMNTSFKIYWHIIVFKKYHETGRSVSLAEFQFMFNKNFLLESWAVKFELQLSRFKTG